MVGANIKLSYTTLIIYLMVSNSLFSLIEANVYISAFYYEE